MLGETGASPDAGDGVTVWARHAMAVLTAAPGVRRVGLALAEGGGRRLRFTASDRDGEIPDWCHVDAYDDVPLNTAIRTGDPVLGSLDELGGRYQGFVARQRSTPTVAVAAVPLVASGQVVGGYVLFLDRLELLAPGRRSELRELGEDLGRALRAAQRAEPAEYPALVDEPVPSDALVAHHEVPPDPASVSRARRFLRGTLEDWGLDEDRTDTAVLCLSELVTNAVIHAQGGCAVRVLLDRGVLTTTVRDGGRAATTAADDRADPLVVHGRGLQLVEALAHRWGSELGHRGTTVWFVLEPEE